MTIPPELLLTDEDIRHLRQVQMAALTGIHPTYFSAWSSYRRISERSLVAIASALGVEPSEILRGFALRRMDIACAKEAQAKADKLITYLQAQKESA